MLCLGNRAQKVNKTALITTGNAEKVRHTNSKVIDKREDPRRANGVVCAHISHDRELRRQRDARSEKVAE